MAMLILPKMLVELDVTLIFELVFVIGIQRNVISIRDKTFPQEMK